ncbi:hypothetical protein [Mycobacterium sp. URHB0021]
MEIALQAPTSANDQNWSFIVITDAQQRRAIAEVYPRSCQRDGGHHRAAAEHSASRGAGALLPCRSPTSYASALPARAPQPNHSPERVGRASRSLRNQVEQGRHDPERVRARHEPHDREVRAPAPPLGLLRPAIDYV